MESKIINIQQGIDHSAYSLMLPVGVAIGVAPIDGVGLINITLIALSSGTGDMTLVRETKNPIPTTTKTMHPTIIVSAAIVFLRSSIL